MKKCLLCNNEIPYEKTICRECWVELKEKYFDNEEYYEETDIEERYENLLKKATKNFKPIKQLAELAVAFYYQEDYEDRDYLIEKLEEDISSMGIKNITQKENFCPICNMEIAEDKTLCNNCWKEAKKGYKEFDHEEETEVREHYFNQRRATYRIKNDEYVEKSKKVMASLAVQMYYDFDDNYLLDRLIEDIQEIDESRNKWIEKEKSKEITEIKTKKEENQSELEDYRKLYPANIRCKDGHYVRSRAEKIIDDWLYDNDYLHVYEKQVYSLEGEEEQIFIPDFYLKKEDLYIEFWGLENNQNYLRKKEEKIDFYKANEITFISLEDAHVEHIDDILPREIARKKKR